MTLAPVLRCAISPTDYERERERERESKRERVREMEGGRLSLSLVGCFSNDFGF